VQLAPPRHLQSSATATLRHLNGITKESKIGVFVTKNGSMTKQRFPQFCRHFVKNLATPK